MRLDPNGIVWAKNKSQNEVQVGQVTLTLFQDKTQLDQRSITRPTQLRDAPQALPLKEHFPGENGAGTLQAGGFENCAKDLITHPQDFHSKVVSGGF